MTQKRVLRSKTPKKRKSAENPKQSEYLSLHAKDKTVPELIDLQESIGNRAAERLIQRQVNHPDAPTTVRDGTSASRAYNSTFVQRSWLDDIGNAISSAAGAVVDTVGDLIDDFDTKSRRLNEDEIAAAREIFGDTLNYSEVVIERNSLYNLGSSRTVGNTIALTDDKFAGRGLELNEAGQHTLIHEMAHVWQYQNQGWEYAPEALWAQLKAIVTTGSRNAAYDWRGLDMQGVPWEDWNPEAQAQAVEDYNRSLRTVRTGLGTPFDYETLEKTWPYVEKMHYPPRGPGDFPAPEEEQRYA